MVEERTRAALEARRLQRMLSPGAHLTSGDANDDHVDPDFGNDITITVEWKLDPSEEMRMPTAARKHRTVRRVFKHGVVSDIVGNSRNGSVLILVNLCDPLEATI
jgi:hypothetical protein